MGIGRLAKLVVVLSFIPPFRVSATDIVCMDWQGRIDRCKSEGQTTTVETTTGETCAGGSCSTTPCDTVGRKTQLVDWIFVMEPTVIGDQGIEVDITEELDLIECEKTEVCTCEWTFVYLPYPIPVRADCVTDDWYGTSFIGDWPGLTGENGDLIQCDGTY